MTFAEKTIIVKVRKELIAVEGASARALYLIVSIVGRKERKVYRKSVIQCFPQLELSSSNVLLNVLVSKQSALHETRSNHLALYATTFKTYT